MYRMQLLRWPRHFHSLLGHLRNRVLGRVILTLGLLALLVHNRIVLVERSTAEERDIMSIVVLALET